MDLELKSDLETGGQMIKLVAGETMCKLVRVLCDQYQYNSALYDRYLYNSVLYDRYQNNSVRRECWAIDIYMTVHGASAGRSISIQ